jgi:glycerophosphoryl diester phosphodiesterase
MRSRMITVAHAYANRRDRWQRAIEAGVDFIETDLQFDRGRVWVRHEHRAGWLPLLYNFRPPASHATGPFALRAGALFLRLDVRPIPFEEFLAFCNRRIGIMLDFKAGAYSAESGRAFVQAVLRAIDAEAFAGALDACGAWPLLDALRERRPGMAIHYSVDTADGWESLRLRLSAGDPIRGITLKHALLDDAKAALLRDAGVSFYVWDVFDDGAAENAVRAGAAGIIADDLQLLRRYAAAPAAGRRP